MCVCMKTDPCGDHNRYLTLGDTTYTGDSTFCLLPQARVIVQSKVLPGRYNCQTCICQSTMSTGSRTMETRREICSKHCKMIKHLSYLQRLTLLMPCSLFAKKVLPYIQPGAVIVGGDLVDAKTLFMQGHQYRQEWEVCA